MQSSPVVIEQLNAFFCEQRQSELKGSDMIKKLLLLFLLPTLTCCSSGSKDDLGEIIMYDKLVHEESSPSFQIEMVSAPIHLCPVNGESIPYELIEQGYVSYYSMYGGVEVPDYALLICRSEEEFAQFWSLHQSGILYLDGYINEPPKIDFNTNMVLIVMSPLLTYTIDRLDLEGIYNTGEEIIVAATMNIAGECCIHLSAGSQPYIIIVLEQSDNVWLSLTETTYSCCQ